MLHLSDTDWVIDEEPCFHMARACNGIFIKETSSMSPCSWRLYVLKCQALQFENMIYLSSWFLTFASNSPSHLMICSSTFHQNLNLQTESVVTNWRQTRCLHSFADHPIVKNFGWFTLPRLHWEISQKKRIQLHTVRLIVDPWQVGRRDIESGRWPIIIRKPPVPPTLFSEKMLTID